MSAAIETLMFPMDSAMAMDIRDKVGSLETKLETSVATLTVQHGHLLEVVARMESSVTRSSEVSAAERKELLSKVSMLETQVAKVTEDLKEFTDKTLLAWLRKNAPALGILLTIITFFVAVIKWLIVNYHPVK
jgi:hypothetical protein